MVLSTEACAQGGSDYLTERGGEREGERNMCLHHEGESRGEKKKNSFFLLFLTSFPPRVGVFCVSEATAKVRATRFPLCKIGVNTSVGSNDTETRGAVMHRADLWKSKAEFILVASSDVPTPTAVIWFWCGRNEASHYNREHMINMWRLNKAAHAETRSSFRRAPCHP